jgi:mRNA interferase MazF
MTSGDIVLLRFPYSDLSGAKLRPAVVVAKVDRGDFVACQITSNAAIRREMISLTPASFSRGALNVASFVLPGKLFTAQDSIVIKTVARLTDVARDQVKDAVVRVIRGK